MDKALASEFITQFLVAAIPVAFAVLGYIAKQFVAWIKSRTSAEQYALLESLATQAVRAAEQTMKTRPGQEKRAAAVAVVRGALLARGITLDETAVVAAVEAAVYANFGVSVTTFEVKK
jgi:LL-H family phage holin